MAKKKSGGASAARKALAGIEKAHKDLQLNIKNLKSALAGGVHLPGGGVHKPGGGVHKPGATGGVHRAKAAKTSTGGVHKS
jgi:hypothetical protein